jgi:hypothetical protein
LNMSKTIEKTPLPSRVGVQRPSSETQELIVLLMMWGSSSRATHEKPAGQGREPRS